MDSIVLVVKQLNKHDILQNEIDDLFLKCTKQLTILPDDADSLILRREEPFKKKAYAVVSSYFREFFKTRVSKDLHLIEEDVVETLVTSDHPYRAVIAHYEDGDYYVELGTYFIKDNLLILYKPADSVKTAKKIHICNVLNSVLADIEFRCSCTNGDCGLKLV